MRIFLLLFFVTTTSAYGEIYMWKDSGGTAHYTNQPDTVPPKYKGRVKVLEMPGDPKNGQGQQPARSSVSLPMPPPPPAAGTPQPSVKQDGAVRNGKRRRTSEED